MKLKNAVCLAVACLLLPAGLEAQSTNADRSIPAELQKVAQSVQAKAAAGKTNEADYAEELKTLDALIASKKDAKTDEAVQFTYMKAMLYLEVMRDSRKGSDIMQQIITNYPNTPYSESAKKIVDKIAANETAKNGQPSVVLSPQLQQALKQIRGKIDAGKTNEADFGEDIRALDGFIGNYKGTNVAEMAAAALNEGVLFGEILGNVDKSTEILKKVQAQFPDTQFAENAAELLDQIVQFGFQQQILKEQMAQFPAGQPMADFDEKDINGKPISLAALKGKVVVLDFWATWCGPCIIEMPNLIAAYQKHHAEGLEVIGVSSDDNRHQLDAFLKKNDQMVWPQYFDGKGTENDLAVKYKIRLIPFTVLLDRDGKVIATYLRGPKLEEAVAKAVAAK